MEGIVSNLLQDGEWTLLDWSRLLPFSLHPFLVDMEPHFVAYLKLMVDSLFVMLSLVLGLTFLQLLLYCLVNQLDPLNKSLCFVPVITPTGVIFPSKDHIKRIFWQVAKTCFKWWTMCRWVHCSIVGMLHIWKMLIPQLRMFPTIASQQMYHSEVENLCLFISLWMKCHAYFQLGVHHLPQAGPKLSEKARVPIWHNRCGQPKMDPNMLKEKISRLLCSDLLFTRH